MIHWADMIMADPGAILWQLEDISAMLMWFIREAIFTCVIYRYLPSSGHIHSSGILVMTLMILATGLHVSIFWGINE